MAKREKPDPRANGRGAAAPQPSVPEETRQRAQAVDRDALLSPIRLGFGAAAETAPAWQHAPSRLAHPSEPECAPMPEAVGSARHFEGTHRGRGPRGYVRSDQRIYEDLCDRLTENPFIDASDVEVLVRDGKVRLAGSLDNAIALRQAEEIAREVAGVAHVQNELTVRAGGEPREPEVGDQVNRAIGPPRRR